LILVETLALLSPKAQRENSKDAMERHFIN